MKAIVIVVPDEQNAMQAARLVGAALMVNGYEIDTPAVIDWPVNPARPSMGQQDQGSTDERGS